MAPDDRVPWLVTLMALLPLVVWAEMAAVMTVKPVKGVAEAVLVTDVMLPVLLIVMPAVPVARAATPVPKAATLPLLVTLIVFARC
jgi:hypothetical protein